MGIPGRILSPEFPAGYCHRNSRPLALATGAGAGSQNAIGAGVLGGTIAGTLLWIFLVPLFYVMIKRIFRDRTTRRSRSVTVVEESR